MLLRNLDPVRGRCNGTRYIVRNITGTLYEGMLACGEYAGNKLLIPRIPLRPTDAGPPFTLRRRQFPVRPAFAMSINKPPGQTLQRVRVGPTARRASLHAWSAVRRCVALRTASEHSLLCRQYTFCCTANVVYGEVFS